LAESTVFTLQLGGIKKAGSAYAGPYCAEHAERTIRAEILLELVATAIKREAAAHLTLMEQIRGHYLMILCEPNSTDCGINEQPVYVLKRNVLSRDVKFGALSSPSPVSFSPPAPRFDCRDSFGLFSMQ
jgi:hypothetical protein